MILGNRNTSLDIETQYSGYTEAVVIIIVENSQGILILYSDNDLLY